MVTGATGGVGRRVVARLLSRGAHVRALVRDVAKGRQMLAGLQAGPGASLELVPADITQRPTLLPEYFAGVRQLICCTAAKVTVQATARLCTLGI
jgi:nucleoside-diphosphate-sugar epimerase